MPAALHGCRLISRRKTVTADRSSSLPNMVCTGRIIAAVCSQSRSGRGQICKSALHLTLATTLPLCYTKATSSVYHRGQHTFCPQLMPANCSAAKQLPQFCKHSKNAAWNIRIHEKREDQHYGTIMGRPFHEENGPDGI